MKKKILGLLIIIVSTQACKKTTVDAEENELITTVKLNFTEGTNTKTFVWKDIDGEGGKNPVIDKISLKPNTSYTLKVEFLDESKTPADNITTEVNEESDEHLLIFTASPTGLASYTYNDKDSNNLPVGLSGTLKTNVSGTGMLKVQLRHQPPINGKNTKDGTATPGSDDANVDFSLSVE